MKPTLTMVLSEQEVETLHEASLRLLTTHGIYVYSDRVLDFLAAHGAQVDQTRRIACLPSRLVEKCLERAPSAFPLAARVPEHNLLLGSGKVYVASGHNAVFLLCTEDGSRRPATKADVCRFARLSDALPALDFLGVQAMPQDVLPRASLLHAIQASFVNCGKHLFFSPEALDVTEAAVRMARVVAGREDLIEGSPVTCQLSSTSPLIWESGAAESVMVVAEAGMPLAILPQPYAGVTAPVTPAGTLLMHNAEVLSGIVLSQMVRPGTPVIYAAAWTIFDMRKANVSIAGPERLLMSVAGAQMARFYRLPSHCIGPDSDSHLHDEQNGWEKALTALVAMSAGVDMLVNAGMFATGMTVSEEQLVMDAELLGAIKRYLQGAEISEETLAEEVIKQVGHKGNFLAEEHTLQHLRKGVAWEPAISCRAIYENWRNSGSPSVVAQARAYADSLLERHTPPPLNQRVAKELADIIADFEHRAASN